MALKRFKTNWRLWLALSLVLFLPQWFIGHIDKDGHMPAAGLWVLLFTDPLNIGAVMFGIIVCTICFAISALAVGWILQSLIVIVLDYVREKRRNAA